MAVLATRRAAVFGTISGNAPMILEFPEKASQSFNEGALMTLDFGYAAEETSESSILILGIAVGKSHNSTPSGTDRIGVAIANQDTLFALSITHSSVASALLSKNLVGKSYGIDIDSEKVLVDISETASARRFMVVRLHPEDTEGDQHGRVVGYFLPQYTQLFGTS